MLCGIEEEIKVQEEQVLSRVNLVHLSILYIPMFPPTHSCMYLLKQVILPFSKEPITIKKDKQPCQLSPVIIINF